MVLSQDGQTVSRSPVIVVVLDTLRYDLEHTTQPSGLPHLRRLADESYLFTRAYAPSHWTLPSHASLFTGLMPHEHMARPPDMLLREDVETVAEIFLREGYFTACVTCNPFLSHTFGTVRGFEKTSLIQPSSWPLKNAVDLILSRFEGIHGPGHVWQELGQRVTSLLTSSPRSDNGASRALRILRRMIRREERTPFLVLNLMEAHSPYHGRGEYSSWRSRVRYSDVFGFERMMFSIMGGRLALTARLGQVMKEIYWENALYMDAKLGELLRMLPEAFLEHGFIIVVSDHGQLLGEKGWVGHSAGLAEKLIRVPLIIRPPGGTQRREIGQPMSITSLFFLLRAIATRANEAFIPWLSWVFKQDPVISQADGGDVPYIHLPRENDASYNLDLLAFKFRYGLPALACVSDRWKLICHLGRREDELYNVEADIEEERNLMNDEPAVLRDLHKKLDERLLAVERSPMQSRRDSLPHGAKRSISEIVLEQALQMRKPVVLWTGGKDSNLVLHLALKVAQRNGVNRPRILVVDHGQHFPETWAFMEETVQREGLRLVVGRNEDIFALRGKGAESVSLRALNAENQKEALRAGAEGNDVPLSLQTAVGNHLLKTVALNRAIREHDFDMVITGIRWDENPARAAEVFFSTRQDPPHTRVHPILLWTEREVWEYTLRNEIPIHPLYHQGYRSFDGVNDSKPMDNRPAWEQDFDASEERAGRAQDKEAIMEKLRALGYF